MSEGGEERMPRTSGTRSARKEQASAVMDGQATVDRDGDAVAAEAAGATAVLGRRRQARTPGVPLDLGWVNDVRVNTSAVERRAATMVARRTVKKEWQAAWVVPAPPPLDP